MAKNLRAKIPSTDKLVIYDVVEPSTKRFIEEVGTATSAVGNEGISIEVAESAREVAEKSVSLPNQSPFNQIPSSAIPQVK